MSLSKFLVLPSVLVLAACGDGGGGTSDTTPTPQPVQYYFLGGTASGIAGTVELQNTYTNETLVINQSGVFVTQNLVVNHSGPFSFPTSLAENSAYSVIILNNNNGSQCQLQNGIGLINSSSINSLRLICDAVTDTDSDGMPDTIDADDDNDGVDDLNDAFPLDPNESIDTDNDGVGDNTDTDDDNDTYADDEDAFPKNASEHADFDADGLGNNADPDDDNDGVEDSSDAFPFNPNEYLDTDADGIGNNTDTDDDNDGVEDVVDAFPLNATESVDTDGDGIGNNADTDDDNDGYEDSQDAFPLDAAEWADTDGDGIGDNAEILSDFSIAVSSTQAGYVSLQWQIQSTVETGYISLSYDKDGSSGFSAVAGCEGLFVVDGSCQVAVNTLQTLFLSGQFKITVYSDTDEVLDSRTKFLSEINANELIQYIKASRIDADDKFGASIAVSQDGETIVVGAPGEGSSTTGINGEENNGDQALSGAVYVFKRVNGNWSKIDYIKSSNTGAGDSFGFSVAISSDGSTLAVSAPYEDTNANGVNSGINNNSSSNSGAVYIFKLTDSVWQQTAFVKAGSAKYDDKFGFSIDMAADGRSLYVGAPYEDGNSKSSSGAVFGFKLNESDVWEQFAYLKATNADAGDHFGYSLAISDDGTRLVIGAPDESSHAVGVDGYDATNDALSSGAAYIFGCGASSCAQSKYLKASNTQESDYFGSSVAISGDGFVIAVGAPGEDSAAGAGQTDNSALSSGAVYLFGKDSFGSWVANGQLKASNAEANDQFGFSLDLSYDGSVMAVGAVGESGAGTGFTADPADNSNYATGAVYLFKSDNGYWDESTYLKAPNANVYAGGFSYRTDFPVSLSNDGSMLVFGQSLEDAAGREIIEGYNDTYAQNSGAIYIFE